MLLLLLLGLLKTAIHIQPEALIVGLINNINNSRPNNTVPIIPYGPAIMLPGLLLFESSCPAACWLQKSAN